MLHLMNVNQLPTASIQIETRVEPRTSHAPIITPDDSTDSCAMPPSSRSIPIQHHLHRTNSELQLHEDEAMADYRDYCMYQRIVSGMVKSQQERSQHMNHLHWGMPAPMVTQPEEPLCNIIRTRHGQTSPDHKGASVMTNLDDGYAFSYVPEEEEYEKDDEDEIFVLDM